MRAIGVSNLRSLQRVEPISLKPITLLIGRNSSGKSTFLRTLPLLRQSVDARKRGPLLWFGSFVDFGGFREAVRSGESEIGLTMSIDIPQQDPGEAGREKYFVGSHLPVELTLRLRADGDDNTKTVSVSLAINWSSGERDVVECELGHPKLESCKVNGEDVSFLFKNAFAFEYSILPLIHFPPEEGRTWRFVEGTHHVLARIAKEETKFFRGNAKPQTRVLELSQLHLSAAGVQNPSTRLGKALQNAARADFVRLRNRLIAARLPRLLHDCDADLSNFSRSISYLAPVRANAQRYYRTQGLAVDEIDHQGENVAMFLKNLSESELQDLTDFSSATLGFSVRTETLGGHASIKLTEGKMNAVNLADAGFGFSQVLPLVVQIWAALRPGPRRTSGRLRTIVIEQPELHLHPNFQAQLAGMLARAIKLASQRSLTLRFVIETHSEALVNRLGVLISNGTLHSNDIGLALFTRSESGTTVAPAHYDEQGFLSDWPYGFLAPSEDRHVGRD